MSYLVIATIEPSGSEIGRAWNGQKPWRPEEGQYGLPTAWNRALKMNKKEAV